MSSSRCRIMEAHDKRDLIEISQLIDLTDKPIGLTRDEISWSKVRSNGSNCICCCCNNSITLVTTDESYILDHVPLDNIQFAQANTSLQYLALSNHRKIAIIDLVGNDIKCGCYNSSSNNNNSLSSETKLVNLASHNLTMNDIIFWRWIDDSTLAILSHEALYTCSVTQHHINHPAYTAFSNRSRYLSMEKVFDCHPNISALSQVTDIHRDYTGNLYAISSLYSSPNLLKLNPACTQHISNSGNPHGNITSNQNNSTRTNGTLKPSFGSMPSRLSQLASMDQQSLDSLKSERLFDSRRSPKTSVPSSAKTGSSDDTTLGLVEVYCKIRDRSQLIRVQAVTFTNSIAPSTLSTSKNSQRRLSATLDDGIKSKGPTIMVAANKVGNKMFVHFIEMATYDNYPSSGKNASPSTQFNHLACKDFPTSIVCSHVDSPQASDSPLHLAMITTKHGQLFICSVTHSTILFNTFITSDVITSTIIESNSHGLMVICRNGQVLLVTLKMDKLMKLLDESKTLRHISSSHNILNSIGTVKNTDGESSNSITADEEKTIVDSEESIKSSASTNHLSASLDVGLDLLITTKL